MASKTAVTFRADADEAALADTQARGVDAQTAAARANAGADEIENADLATLTAETIEARDAARALLSPVATDQPDSGAATLLAIDSFRAGLKGLDLPEDTDLTEIVGRRTVNSATQRHIRLADLATGAFTWSFLGDETAPNGRTILTATGLPDVVAYVDWDLISSGTTQAPVGQGVRLSPSALIGGEADPIAAGSARKAALVATPTDARLAAWLLGHRDWPVASTDEVDAATQIWTESVRDWPDGRQTTVIRTVDAVLPVVKTIRAAHTGEGRTITITNALDSLGRVTATSFVATASTKLP